MCLYYYFHFLRLQCGQAIVSFLHFDKAHSLQHIQIVGSAVGLLRNNHEGGDVAAKSGDDEFDGFDCDDGCAKLNRGHEIGLTDS